MRYEQVEMFDEVVEMVKKEVSMEEIP